MQTYRQVNTAPQGFARSYLSRRVPRCNAAATGVPDIKEFTTQQTLDGKGYAAQYDILFDGRPLDTKKVTPKPNRAANQFADGAKEVPFSANIFTVEKSTTVKREKTQVDKIYVGFILAMHVACLAAPFCFSWTNVAIFGVTYFITGCLGITLSFHRQLAHKSFQTPKWLEYVFAYCGALAVQGDPKEWVSTHRYHHLHCETPLDPHSSYEGFWWSHMGWILENAVTLDRVGDRTNIADMASQPFYNHLEKHYNAHLGLMFAALFAVGAALGGPMGGLGAMVWGGAVRVVWVWHVTWFVNSVCHLWGKQTYNTGDLSMNNWWVGLLAWGEGWHNNHHAFEFSARHGLEWWQFDMTWMLIKGLQTVGLATKVKLPTEKQKARLAF